MANLTVTRPLSFWSRNDPIQFKQPFSDVWPKMKCRAMAAAAGTGKQCNVANCNSASCGTSACSCICHFAMPAAQNQQDTENMPLFMSGLQRSKTEPNLATHPAVTVRKYLLESETGDPKAALAKCSTHPSTPGGAGCGVVSSSQLPYINDPNFAKCCQGPQMWFTRRVPTSIETKEKLRTSVNERAKSGFRYWYQERPKPTRFGSYSIGSKYTQMGLGFAPRS